MAEVLGSEWSGVEGGRWSCGGERGELYGLCGGMDVCVRLGELRPSLGNDDECA